MPDPHVPDYGNDRGNGYRVLERLDNVDFLIRRPVPIARLCAFTHPVHVDLFRGLAMLNLAIHQIYG
jgi:hypothetical protein